MKGGHVTYHYCLMRQTITGVLQYHSGVAESIPIMGVEGYNTFKAQLLKKIGWDDFPASITNVISLSRL